MNLFVTKLDFQTKESTLRAAFEKYGEVTDVKIVTDKMSGRSKGYGFVEMSNDDDGMNAINGLNETELDGRTIIVKKAEPRESRPPRTGGGGGGGFRGGNGGGGGNRNRRF
ncbi:MAG: RNA-binding protein [Saprospiraceae bacterium]|nr:RNA-binding protein [Saprospiraceae bacterium]